MRSRKQILNIGRIGSGVDVKYLLMFSIIITQLQSITALGQVVQQRMLRVSMDNDFFAYQKEDGAYTNGLRFDFISEGKENSKSLERKFYFHTGNNSLVVKELSLTQIMFTSNDITKKDPMPGDYPYSGSLLITRSFNSISPHTNLSVKTEYVGGIMGPYSFACETQRSFHKLINDGRPQGWEHQFPNTLFFNVNISIHRYVLRPAKTAELVFLGEVNTGSLTNRVSIASLLRLGRMLPYFNSHVQQFITPRSTSWQLYVFVKPQASFVGSNLLLEGTAQKSGSALAQAVPPPQVSIRHAVFTGDLGLVISYRVFAFSFTFIETTGLILNQPNKALGNVSLYIAL